MKLTLKNILYSGLAIACIAFNMQYVFVHSAVAAAVPEQSSETKILAIKELPASILDVVNVVLPAVALPSTIQNAVQPSAINILALQSTADNVLFENNVSVAFAVQNVTPSFTLLDARAVARASAIQSPVIAEATPQQVMGLPANPPYYMSDEKDGGVIALNVVKSSLAISQESKSFANVDMTTLLRC